MRAMLRVAFASGCLAAALATGTTSAGAAVTIGQTGPVSGLCSQDQEWAQQVVSSGSTYVVPPIAPASDLSITSWSHQAYTSANQQIRFKVYRPILGLTYRVVAQDERPLTPDVLNTFSANLPVEPGDILGISNGPNTPNLGCGTGAFSETDLLNNGSNAGPGTPPGGDVTFQAIGGARLNVSAVVEPTNTFSFGATTRNARKGTATVTLNVPNPGEVTASGNGVKAASAARDGASAAKVVPGLSAELTIKAKGKKLKKLKRTGKAKLNATFTYTPTGGAPSTQSTTLTLRKKR